MTEPGGRDTGDGRGPRRTRSPVWAAATAVLMLVFVAGMGAGWGGARRLCRPTRGGGNRPTATWLCGRRGGGGDPMARLDLSTAERARVDSAVQLHQPQVEAFWRGPGRQLRAILDSMHTDVRAALPAGKRETYDSLTARGRRGPGGPGGPGGRGGPPPS